MSKVLSKQISELAVKGIFVKSYVRRSIDNGPETNKIWSSQLRERCLVEGDNFYLFIISYSFELEEPDLAQWPPSRNAGLSELRGRALWDCCLWTTFTIILVNVQLSCLTCLLT